MQKNSILNFRKACDFLIYIENAIWSFKWVFLTTMQLLQMGKLAGLYFVDSFGSNAYICSVFRQ